MGEESPDTGELPPLRSGEETGSRLSDSPGQIFVSGDRPAGIPIVGLGGSAGALAALEAFFEAMPADSDAAFVIIQHLSPDHPSMLSEILSEHTGMRVMQARQGLPVEPNCVYIIPPNQDLGLRHGTLFMKERSAHHGIHMPIDFFFRCLAEDREEQALCIVLSGAGSDGTLGARAVRGGGGMVIAQEPQTCGFDDMPRSVLAAGLADYVLAPERMPQAVLQYLQHPYVKGQERSRNVEAQANLSEVQDILELMRVQTGCDFRCYKAPTILRRIGRRMGLLRMVSVAQYVALLRRDAGEAKLLFRDLLINVTSFFRDPEAFEELRDQAVAPMVQAKPNSEPVRVWVPACSTGEEAYSLAMLLMEELAKAAKTCPLQVFATDLDEEALEVARCGFYPENIAADVGDERLAKFFVRKDTGYKVKESLREVLTFATQNVITDPPFSRMDLISCRNLLIYLEPETQSKLMGLFNFAIRPGGYLLLGRSETTAGQNDLFEVVSKRAKLCRRLTPARPPVLDSAVLPGRRRSVSPTYATSGPVASNFADMVRLEILKRYGASAVLVDPKGRVFQFHGQPEKYLNLPAPGPGFNLFELAKQGMAMRLRLAVHKAVQEDQTVILEGVPFVREEGEAFARVVVTPVAQRVQRGAMLVVFFEDVLGQPAAPAQVLQLPENETAIKRLEDELLATQHDLQASIQELQSSNEELRAANEEVTSTNEELESTNEELVSSTEELQSSNEELTAVVSQLQEKVELLDQANHALGRSEQRFRTLVESSPNAVLLVGADGRIDLANRQAEVMFGYTRNELIGQAVELLVPARLRKDHLLHRAGFMADPQSRPMGSGRDLFAVRKDGSEFPVEVGLTPLAMPEGLVVSVTITDITGRKPGPAGKRRR